MIKMTAKNHLYSFERYWFPAKDDAISSGSDIVKYMRFKQPMNCFAASGICYVDSTLITDLNNDEQLIFNQFSKTHKTQIKKSLKDGSIKIDFFTARELKESAGIIDDFEETFRIYCEKSQKEGLKRVFSRKNIDQYIQYCCIMVSRAEFQNGKAYHLYVWDQEDCLLVYTVSDHLKEEVSSILAGMANRLLHYKDILWFKEKGLLYYDWGNVTDFNNPNGIDRFKMAFGGRHMKVYSYLIGNTLKGKILVQIKKYAGGK